MAFTQITVTGNFQDGAGAAVDGTVTFTPTEPMRNTTATTEATVDKPIVRAIVGGVLASTTLAATDDPGTTPTGVTYQVDVRINRQSGTETYNIEVPYDGGAIDLATVPRATTVTPAMASYLTQPDADALYEPLGGGGGGGAVTSVNGDTGVVVLTAADVGAQPTDSDLTAIAGLTHADDTILQTKAGAWAARTPAQIKTDLALVKADVGLGSVDNTADTAKPISTATQTALDGKQTLDSDLTAIAGLTPSNDDVVQRKAGAWTNRTPAQVKTDLALTKSDVGLSNVDNTADASKPVSAATQTALDGKQTLDSDLTAFAALTPTNDDVLQRKAGAWTNRTPAQVKTDLALTSADVGLGSVDNVSAASLRDRSTHTGTQSADTVVDGTTNHAFTAADDTKLTGIATGATANSSDATLLDRANHTGTQAQSTVTNLVTDLAAKAPLASPTFTGTVSGVTKTHVGLGNVDNTSDAAKPISTATQTALDLKARIPDVQVFTSSGTWTKPAGAAVVTVYLISGGGGGGSGARHPSGTATSGGAGGGGGGWNQNKFRAVDCDATETVTVGTGGPGGAARATDATNGQAGTVGVASSFGTVIKLRAGGGSGGAGGNTAAAAGGGGGLGAASPATGGGGVVGAAGSNGNSAAAAGPSGGGGGGVSATPTAAAGGSGGGASHLGSGVGAGTSGTAGGTAGGAGGTTPWLNAASAGGGGGGGGGNAAGVGGTGGVGGTYGGGGGGGGSSLNGSNSGAGGDGGPGVVIVISE